MGSVLGSIGLASAPGLASGLGSVGASAINASAQRDVSETNLQSQRETNASNEYNVAATNAANRAIADATNKANYELWLQQNAEQWKMWNAENEYNSPVAQRQRARDAGLNPALAAMNGVNVGTASSMSAPSPSPAVGATMQPFRADAPVMSAVDYGQIGSALMSSVSNIVDLALKQEDITRLKTDNAYRDADWRVKLDLQQAEIANKLQSTELSRAQRANLKQQYDYIELVKDSRVKGEQIDWQKKAQELQVLRQQELNMLAERDNIRLQMDISRARLKLDSQHSMALIKQVYSLIDLQDKQGKLTDAQQNTEIARFLHEYAKANGQEITNQNADSLAKALIRQYDTSSDLNESQTYLNDYMDNSGVDFGIIKLKTDLKRGRKAWSTPYNDRYRRTQGYND